MKKALKKAKEKTGRLVDRLLPSPRSQSPVPADPGESSVPPVLLAPDIHAEAMLGSMETAGVESATVLQPLETIGVPLLVSPDFDPIPPAPSTVGYEYEVFQAETLPIGSLGLELPEVSRLSSNASMTHDVAQKRSRIFIISGQVVLNNNQNTTYNFGRDVFNNNPVTNNITNNPVTNIYITKAGEDNMKQIKTTIGNHFVPSALYETQSEDAGCMLGTRTRVLSMFMEWVKNDPMRIFWLAGLAGTGKTSIAITLCRMLQDEPNVLLGGAFFCSRTANVNELTDARCILPTLATALARKSPTFAAALAAELNADSIAASKPISAQVESLLRKPLVALASVTSPIAFIIDALDECSDENEVKKLLQAISAFNCDVKVKFILTSRPETLVSSGPISSSNPNSILRLHTIDPAEVTEDICLYIGDAFAKRPLVRQWYSDTDVKTLAILSDGLFIFASTVISYVLKVQSVKGRANRLKTVLSAIKDSKVVLGPLNAMYDLVLTRASDTAEIEPKELKVTLQVLACITDALLPLSIRTLAELLELETDELQESLRRLHAVVHVPDEVDQPGLRTLHASFEDYLSARLHISKSLGAEALARGCLRVMRQQLHFNVSKSQSSYEPNLAIRPSSVTPSVEYACIQWIYHVASLDESSTLDKDIDEVFRPRLLFWLEVMSVLGRVWRAAAMLIFAASTVQNVELSQFFHDAHAFVASSREAIERSAPHIYLSALPFAAKDSLIYCTFTPLLAGLISVDTFGIDRHGGRLVMTLTGHEREVNCVAYSPDGILIASCSKDCTVRVWDVRSGEEVMSLLNGGEDDYWATSVAFAPDGRSLAAGTEEGLICIWDVPARYVSLQRLCGHSESVSCVTFSPDGAVLASTSQDRTVHVWRVGIDEPIFVLRGHEERVEAAVFSPAGDILASCSYDRTIRFWDTATGRPIGQPLKGHSNRVLSVSFSPDGSKLASGSADRDIRLWETRTGTCIATLHSSSVHLHCVHFSPDGQLLASAGDDVLHLWTLRQDIAETSFIVLEGHSGWIPSVTFSPNSLYIASASEDCTIRIWNTVSSPTTSQPLQSHVDGVDSVAVSTDGDFIASGSCDHSVRIWNAQTGQQRFLPLLGHTKRVNAVAISSDGSLIASASEDHTVRIWDAQTGGAIGEPLREHDAEVNTITFSSNGMWLASGSDDETVRIWDVSTRQPTNVGLLRCDAWVSTVAFSPGYQLVAAGDFDGRVHLWNMDIQQAHELLYDSANSIRSIAFSSSGTCIVAGGDERVARVWNVSTRLQILTLESLALGFDSIAFSPGDHFIGASLADGGIALWDAVTGTQIVILHGHGSIVKSVAFTSNGQSVVSGSWDSTIRVWDVASAISRPWGNGGDPVMDLASTKLQDGWLMGTSGELLLWVPEDYRAYLYVPPCTMIIGPRRIVVTADDPLLYHGKNWTAVWSGD